MSKITNVLGLKANFVFNWFITKKSMLSKYTDIFIDLDNTIWDFTTNSKNSLFQMYHQFDLFEKTKVVFNEFFEIYEEINKSMWLLYKENKIERDTLRHLRFYDTLKHFEIDSYSLANDLMIFYEQKLSEQDVIFPNARNVLQKLYNSFDLHILSNGFDFLQKKKLEKAHLEKYFKNVITSEECGYAKPKKEIFEYAIKKAKANAVNCVMIGDEYETDIVPAKNIGMFTIFFNINNLSPAPAADYCVKNWNEIKKILLPS